MAEEPEDPSKSFVIFGRDVAQIPCFRNSFLYGISGGIGIGLLTFLGTSRTHLSTHVGFGSFFCGTIVYWMSCRYQWSARRFEQQQLREAMRRQALYEGTNVEQELDLKSA
ncbi:GL24382 [Drosophila persimilis]|uniref:Cytochrome c oxidase assembly protein COX20, mitochondrial n=3 Tax=pseudoobscura subgroup TaxID=32358 RepID=A0A6I8V2K9_DROPS|nr:cytochrome c oxidase assembly protein COX20, mitochondrial [Drosophila persimilis]XP_002137357.1 cytochrome c oxidase assembly protein COX20, mitochondrial [Drosophila pseudoobscura]EDW24873.1 GL24382 [Drosophila persimilis]